MNHARIIVVTGTDTGVGKTFVTAALAERLAGQGIRVVAVKPVESGCPVEPSESEDGVQLAQATGQKYPDKALTRLRTPVAPPLAADLERVSLDPRVWIETIRKLADDAEVLLVEGAGGLLSPLTWSFTLRDLADRLDAECLVVAADKLGTLNHTLLTMECLERSNRPVLGVVFSTCAETDGSSGRNAESFVRFKGKVPVVSLPRCENRRKAIGFLESIAEGILS